MQHRMRGTCHCGAVAVELETDRAPAELPVRMCACTFCRRHQPRYTSDPDGRVTIATGPGALQYYRFGTGTADFLVCTTCGVFVGAVCEEGGVTRAVVNVNNLDDADAFAADPEVVSRDGETVQERAARRARSWTPAEVSEP